MNKQTKRFLLLLFMVFTGIMIMLDIFVTMYIASEFPIMATILLFVNFAYIALAINIILYLTD